MGMRPPNTQRPMDMPQGMPHVNPKLVSLGAHLPLKHNIPMQPCTSKLVPRTKKVMHTNRHVPGGLPLPLHHKAKHNDCNSNNRRNMKDRCIRSILVKITVEVLSILQPLARRSIAMGLRDIVIVRRV